MSEAPNAMQTKIAKAVQSHLFLTMLLNLMMNTTVFPYLFQSRFSTYPAKTRFIARRTESYLKTGCAGVLWPEHPQNNVSTLCYRRPVGVGEGRSGVSGGTTGGVTTGS